LELCKQLSLLVLLFFFLSLRNIPFTWALLNIGEDLYFNNGFGVKKTNQKQKACNAGAHIFRLNDIVVKIKVCFYYLFAISLKYDKFETFIPFECNHYFKELLLLSSSAFTGT
jgi:hypothetical protein